MNIKALVITNTYPTQDNPGDTPCIKDQLDELIEKGVEIKLFHIDRRKKINYIKTAWRVFTLSFRKKKYDIIHAYYGHSGLIARLQFKYPIITTFRGSDLLSAKDGIIGRLIINRIDAAVVMTEEMKRVSKRDDVYIIPFGVNKKIFKPYSKKLARRELGLPLKKKLILFPWNISRPVKRFDIVQEVFEQLLEKYAVDIVTVFDKPPKTVSKYMNACDVMILASNHEGSPMAVREALSCHLPIVSVDVGDVAEMIRNVKNCYLVDQDVREITKKVTAIFETKQSRSEKRITESNTLSAEHSANEIIKIYQKILQS